MPVAFHVRKNQTGKTPASWSPEAETPVYHKKKWKTCLQEKCWQSSDAQWRRPALVRLEKYFWNRSLLPPFGQLGYCSWSVAFSFKRKQFTNEQTLPSLHLALAKQHLISLITQFIHFLCFSTCPTMGCCTEMSRMANFNQRNSNSIK